MFCGCGCGCICSGVDINHNEKQLRAFPGKVKGTQGDRKEFDFRIAQFCSDNNCFAPAWDVEAPPPCCLPVSSVSLSNLTGDPKL